MSEAYIGLGSNLSKPRQQIMTALSVLEAASVLYLKARSSLYRSSPMGPGDQPDYVNAVAALDTKLGAAGLLHLLQTIERQQGRKSGGQRWGPRILDLDLLLFDDLQLKTAELTIPHPGLHERAFVLYPLAEINPKLYIPTLGALQDLLKVCPKGSLERLEG